MNRLVDDRLRRRQLDLVGVNALADLLRNVASKPEDYAENSALQSALRSQGALAKYSDPRLSLRPMSLNHQRAIAEEALGSFRTLDSLRRAAIESLRVARAQLKRGNARTKEGLHARVHELEGEVSLLKQDLAVLQRAYDLRCLQARAYAAEANNQVQTRCAKEQREIDVSFSLLRRPSAGSSVVSLEEGRKRVRPVD
jgi:hypothetical protein